MLLSAKSSGYKTILLLCWFKVSHEDDSENEQQPEIQTSKLPLCFAFENLKIYSRSDHGHATDGHLEEMVSQSILMSSFSKFSVMLLALESPGSRGSGKSGVKCNFLGLTPDHTKLKSLGRAF